MDGAFSRPINAFATEPGRDPGGRQTGRSERVDEEGKIEVFFELNGQLRNVRVPKAGIAGFTHAKVKAEKDNPNHVCAPMPGMVVTVAAKVGQKVIKGDLLLSPEAMKMETVLSADCDATVYAVHV